MKQFRSHGIDRDYKSRQSGLSYRYNMNFLGYNYRLPDLNCALGISQLEKLDSFVEKRRALVKYYNDKIDEKKLINYIKPVIEQEGNISAWHIMVVRVLSPLSRDELFKFLYKNNIRANVHYTCIHLHPFYQSNGWKEGDLPISEKVSNEIITLPLYPLLTFEEVDKVINCLEQFITKFFLLS